MILPITVSKSIEVANGVKNTEASLKMISKSLESHVVIEVTLNDQKSLL